MPPKLVLCYCDPPFNRGRPVLAVCDVCEARHLERTLKRQGKVAREHPSTTAWDALVESYYRSLDAVDRETTRAGDYMDAHRP